MPSVWLTNTTYTSCLLQSEIGTNKIVPHKLCDMIQQSNDRLVLILITQ